MDDTTDIAYVSLGDCLTLHGVFAILRTCFGGSVLRFEIFLQKIMGYSRFSSWITAIFVTIAMPLCGLFILGAWWRFTFSWDVYYTPPFYWNVLLILAVTMIVSTPIPLIWTAVSQSNRKKVSKTDNGKPKVKL